MTKQQRAEKAKLHKDLVDLLVDEAPNDESYYTRLIWANQIIANILSNWNVCFEEGEGE